MPTIAGYTGLTLLGGGGFAHVYVARRQADGAEVALKVAMNPGDERFAREAAALRRLGAIRSAHPEVTALAPALLGDGVTADQRPFLVMERIHGVAISEWLAGQAGTPPLAEALAIFTALADAVDRMHAAGVLHRDLKPENAFLRADGRVTLIDLGLARDLTDEGGLEADSRLTMTGQRVGTATYMAPEQCLGARELDTRTDLYALGVMLFELLSGRPPFVGDLPSVEQGHVSRRPPRLSELAPVPPAVDAVLLRCLAKQRAQRFPNAREMVLALEAAIATSSTPPRSAPAADAATPARASSRREVALLAVTTRQPMRRVADAVAPERGQVARVVGELHVIAFVAGEGRTDGLRAALKAAHRVAEFADGSVAHIADLRLRDGPQGMMMIGQALDRSAEWGALPPASQRQDRILLTAAAAAVLDRSMTRPVAEGLFALHTSETLAPETPPSEIELRGRADLLASVAAGVETCFRERRPTLTTIVGEVGHGKSRVLRALAETCAAVPGARVIKLVARRPEQQGHAETEGVLGELLRAAFTLPAGQLAVSAIDAACTTRLGPVLGARAWPVVALYLDALPDTDAALASTIGAPGALRHTVARAAASALLAAAAEQPLAVLLDDAQWADHATLDALELACMAAGGGATIFVAVTAGPQLAAMRPSWGDRAAHSASHQLAPLDEAAAGAMLGELLHPVEYVPGPVLARLYDLTHGIPLYLVEVAHAMRASGAIRPLRGTGAWFVASDDLLQFSSTSLTERLAKRTLAALPASLLQLTQLCAVLGDVIDVADVEGALRFLDDVPGAAVEVDPSVGLGRLVRLGALRGQGTRYRFRHPMLREAIESLLPLPLRQRMHDAARRYLAEAPLRSSAAMERLARHASRSGARAEAARAWLHLAREASARHRYVAAEEAYSAALGHLTEQDQAARQLALAGRAKMRYRVRRMADSLDDVRAAHVLAEARHDDAAVADLLLEEATILDWSSDFAASAEVARRAESLIRTLFEPNLDARCLFALGRTRWRLEKPAEAVELLSAAAARAQDLGDQETRTLSLVLLGPALVYVGRLDDAAARFDEALALCEHAGDRLHLGVLYGNRMVLWLNRGDYEHAIGDTRLATELAREVGNAQLERVAQYNLGELLCWMGKLDEALAVARRARDLQLRFYEHLVPEDSLLCARIHSARGDDSEATELLGWIADKCPRADIAPSQLALLRMVELVSGRANEGAWNELRKTAQQHSVPSERLEILYAAARAALREGRTAAAASIVAEAATVPGGAPSAMWGARFVELAKAHGIV